MDDQEMDIGTESRVIEVAHNRKWFEVDFNVPGRTVIVAKPGHWEGPHMEYHTKLPEVGENIMIYTFDDAEPFAFEAVVYEVDESEDCWIVHSREFGPYYHWRTC